MSNNIARRSNVCVGGRYLLRVLSWVLKLSSSLMRLMLKETQNENLN